MDTGRRLAKMYINELMCGRYDAMPNATAFPNDSDDRYEGMLVVRSELISMCLTTTTRLLEVWHTLVLLPQTV